MAQRRLPRFSQLSSSYPAEDHPCDQGWDNQCAIRVSVALVGAGFHLSGYRDPLCKHGHARGAEALGTYLWNQTVRPEIYKTAQAAESAMRNRAGVVLFKDIAGFRGGRGDHIDIWDGTETETGAYFQASKQVWFWYTP